MTKLIRKDKNPWTEDIWIKNETILKVPLIFPTLQCF